MRLEEFRKLFGLKVRVLNSVKNASFSVDSGGSFGALVLLFVTSGIVPIKGSG
jgi:hypothetical protein